MEKSKQIELTLYAIRHLKGLLSTAEKYLEELKEEAKEEANAKAG